MLTSLNLSTARNQIEVRDKVFQQIYDQVDRQVWLRLWIPGRSPVWRRVRDQVYQALRREAF